MGALKVGNLLSAEADAELSPGHARDCFYVRGQHPQEVRRGCKGLKPQQHTQGPLLQVGLYCVTRCKPRHRDVDVCVIRLMAVGGQ